MTNDPSAAKYQIKARIVAEGVIDKPDVVGAVFGQTEGLLGEPAPRALSNPKETEP